MTSEEIDCLRAKMKCLWKNSKRDFPSNKVVTWTFTEEERNMLDYIVEKPVYHERSLCLLNSKKARI